ncbi:MAG: carbohydrate-binding family 9-like protein [Bryobacteraceae bacterium]
MFRFAASVLLLACCTQAQVQNVIDSHFAPQDEPLEWNPASSFWRNVPATEIATDNFGKAQPAHRTEIRSRWTTENLYFQFTCRYEELYSHPDPSRTAETNKLWDWDVAEVFIGSDFENIRRYREFEMSPRGEWLDLDIDLARAVPADGWTWNSGFEVKASIDKKNKIWYGAMRIPYRSVDSRAAAAGSLLRVNFYREQGPLARRVEIAWQPTMQRTYHVPERFGTLKLTK